MVMARCDGDGTQGPIDDLIFCVVEFGHIAERLRLLPKSRECRPRSREVELVGSKEVGFGYVADVGIVEEVVVVTDLEVGLASFVHLVETGHDLTISRTKARMGDAK